MNLLKVSVIIPTFKSWENLRNCLNALSKQTITKDTYEVIIVNNDPEHKCPFELPESNMKIIEEMSPGSYAARNKGVKNAKASILAFTDDDCIVEGDWIKNALIHFNKTNKVSRLAGQINIFDNEKYSSSSVYDQIFSFDQVELAKKGASVTANMFTRASVFEKIGLFNENLKSGGDTEWGLRAEAENFDIIFAKDVMVNHPVRNKLREIVVKNKRIYGGHFMLNGWNENTFITNLLYSLYPLRPPVRALKKIIQSNDFKFSQKLKAVYVLVIVRLTNFIEHFNLSLGKPTERN